MVRALDPHKKEAIMTAARMIFIRDGYRAAKMTDIAAAAGVAAGTLYLYFNSKEALSNALSEDFFNRCALMIDQYVPHIADENGLTQYIDSVIQIARDEMPVLSFARIESFEKAGKGKEVRKELSIRTANHLQKLMDEKAIRNYDAIALADMIGGMLHKVIMSCVVEQTFDLATHKATAIRILEYALFESRN